MGHVRQVGSSLLPFSRHVAVIPSRPGVLPLVIQVSLTSSV
jgi:hypothetical protein